jgi:hypothetical protein
MSKTELKKIAQLTHAELAAPTSRVGEANGISVLNRKKAIERLRKIGEQLHLLKTRISAKKK